MVSRCLFLLAALLVVVPSSQGLYAQGNPVFSNYEYCVTDDGTFGLYKPKGWKVGTPKYPNSRMVFVTDPMEKVREMTKKTSSMMSRYAEEMRQSSLASHQNRMKSSDFISYKFSTYMRGEQEWVTGLEGGKIYTTDHWGLSSGGRTIIEGPPFNYYNYQGDAWYGHIPVDSSREVFEAVKGY